MRLKRLRMRDIAVFVIVAGMVAVVAVFAGREAGVGQRTEAVTEGTEAEPQRRSAEGQVDQQTEPRRSPETQEDEEALQLTLSASEICETERARNVGGWELRTNDQGARVHEFVSTGWRVFAETSVSWRVGGGTPPYTLTIDGEPRDAHGAYKGQSGVASVGCADPSVGTFFEEVSRQVGMTRLYRANPDVDSGSKTIRGVVTDANGSTAEASVQVYVILAVDDDGEVLKRGRTYRVRGHLLTAPANYDVELDGIALSECPENPPPGYRCETEYSFAFVGVDAGLALYASDFAEASRWNRSVAGASGSTAASIDDAIDDFVDSVGQPPR